ncbi:hypothetical protein PR002_g13538 [Phytophthora rubi]|uniref:Uncharacterized protein n=1 Tax=Phytophthora rubi TaxID=129364 RepID=A0A6A3LBU8_9STRA|nr:hypothetical protein PR002_g13538 [Phytophthora rubi]
MNKFYMRVLLCRRKGPQSFEQLRTVDGVTYETYRQAAMKLGYLEDDAEWIACMTEAAAFKKPHELRQQFATIIVYSQVSEVRQMWDQFYDDLSQDYAYTYRALQGQEKEDLVQFKTLKSLHDLLQINGYAVADFDLPQLHQYPALVLDSLLRNSLLRRELEGYDQSTLQSIVGQEDQINVGQRSTYDEILQAVDGSAQGDKCFLSTAQGHREIYTSVVYPGKGAPVWEDRDCYGFKWNSLTIAHGWTNGAFNVQNTSQVERQVDVCDLQAIESDDADSEGQFSNLG